MRNSIALGPRSRGPWLLAVLCLWLFAALPGCGKQPDSGEEIRKKKAIESSLREQKVNITKKSYPPFGTGYVVDMSDSQVNDDELAKLKQLEMITEFNLSKSSITDAQMDKINEFAHVILRLDLSNTGVTDAGLEKLTNLNKCMNLKLTGTKVTPEAAERFKQKHTNRPNIRGFNFPPMEVEM